MLDNFFVKDFAEMPSSTVEKTSQVRQSPPYLEVCTSQQLAYFGDLLLSCVP